jgi:hypothetical protein
MFLPILLYLFKVYESWVYLCILTTILMLFALRIRRLESKMLFNELIEKGAGITIIFCLYIYYVFSR